MHWCLSLFLTVVCPGFGRDQPTDTLVVTNPSDVDFEAAPMSVFAPWIALQKNAPVVFTNRQGDNVAQAVMQVLKTQAHRIEHVILVGSLRAIPMERRANPLAGKDEWIETEPLSPAHGQPFTFAVGRIFHSDPSVVRRLLLNAATWDEPRGAAPKALIASNPGGRLTLLEAFSRASALELRNAGFEVAAFYGADCNRADIRRLLPEQTIFLFEGHQSTLIRDYEAHRWKEPLRPSLILLQSCLALTEDTAGPFLTRGALAVVGVTSRTYSASGGAFTLSYLDALLHEKQTLGEGMRHAKNFLVAFAQLKEQRLGERSQLGGANLRSACAFTLWGDPTLRLPATSPIKDRLSPVRHEVRGNTIVVHVPATAYPRLASDGYYAELAPNARLGGFFRKEKMDERHELVPLLFREVHLPDGAANATPALRTKIDRRSWVFLWDARRRTGYLLIRPPAHRRELRFDVEWAGRDNGITQDHRTHCLARAGLVNPGPSIPLSPVVGQG